MVRRALILYTFVFVVVSFLSLLLNFFLYPRHLPLLFLFSTFLYTASPPFFFIVIDLVRIRNTYLEDDTKKAERLTVDPHHLNPVENEG
jgi:hypothetical protein